MTFNFDNENCFIIYSLLLFFCFTYIKIQNVPNVIIALARTILGIRSCHKFVPFFEQLYMLRLFT